MRNDVRCDLWQVIAGALVAAVLFVVAAPASFLPQANAAVPACFTHNNGDDYGALSSAEYNGGSLQTTLNGMRADIPIKTNVVCQKVYSTYIYKANQTALFEFGYAMGHIACFNDQTFEWHANPTLIAVAYESDGTRHCKIWGSSNHPTSGNTDSFRASDLNENGYWGGWWNGTEMQPSAWNLAFTQGFGGTNAERARPNETGLISFTAHSEAHSGLWTSTENITGDYDQDPEYKWQTPNGQTANVVVQ